MPLIPGKSPATVSKNISEFHKGPTFEHTSEKFGKDRANKQAVAVALHSAGKSKDDDKGKPEDHKAAVAKMNPEHVHKLVQDAHAGKYGPQAQQVAQSATEPQAAMPPQGDGDADDTGSAPAASDRSSMFSSGPGPAAPAGPPPNRASMFQGR
jgi:hypothetical protein